MNWKAQIVLVQQVNQGDMQVDALMADIDQDPRIDYPWTHVYPKEWLEARTDQQVQQEIQADMTAYAQILASSAARTDSLKDEWEGEVIDLDVT